MILISLCKYAHTSVKPDQIAPEGTAWSEFGLNIVSCIYIQIRVNTCCHSIRTFYSFHEACLFDLILYVPSTIFQLYRNGSSWVEPVRS